MFSPALLKFCPLENAWPPDTSPTLLMGLLFGSTLSNAKATPGAAGPAAEEINPIPNLLTLFHTLSLTPLVWLNSLPSPPRVLYTFLKFPPRPAEVSIPSTWASVGSISSGNADVSDRSRRLRSWSIHHRSYSSGIQYWRGRRSSWPW